MKRTGIILELDGKKAVVMTNDAEFIAIKREPEMYTGAPVELDPPVPGLAFLQSGFFGKNLWASGLAGLTVTAILILAFTFLLRPNAFRSGPIQYAYVTVDINPSVEFTLNQKILVSRVRDINEDGRSLLQGPSLINMPLTQALLTLVNRAEQAGYFTSETERKILVSTVTNKPLAGNPKLLEAAISQCNTLLDARKIQMRYIQATLSQRKIALKNHLSTGRFALWSYATGTAGQKISLKTAKIDTIGRLIDAAGLLPGAYLTDAARTPKTVYQANTKTPKINSGRKPALVSPNSSLAGSGSITKIPRQEPRIKAQLKQTEREDKTTLKPTIAAPGKENACSAGNASDNGKKK
ncbi:MAG: anti-sigma factor domain-containing protein [Firmicutes bacterium]|nr:anti-sigma factor domain-containing protein [Bacillota bacterium]